MELNHLNSENIIVESYYDNDTDASTVSSFNSVSSTKREAIKWVESKKFNDLVLAVNSDLFPK